MEGVDSRLLELVFEREAQLRPTGRYRADALNHPVALTAEIPLQGIVVAILTKPEIEEGASHAGRRFSGAIRFIDGALAHVRFPGAKAAATPHAAREQVGDDGDAGQRLVLHQFV